MVLRAVLKAFQKWLETSSKKSKYTGDAIEFREAADSKGNGVFVKGDRGVQKEEVVLDVPLELCLFTKFVSDEESKETEGFGVTIPDFVLQNQIVSTLPAIELAMALIQESAKGEKSFFAPYLAIIPSYFDTMPLTWSIEELMLIARDMNCTVVLHRIADVCLMYCQLAVMAKPWLREFVGTFQNFLWAVCVVHSRQNPLPSKSGTVSKLALVPAFDLCNHDPSGAITTDYSCVSKSFQCRAHKSFNGGEEFTIFYGPRPDLEFLLYSGFVCSPAGVNENSALILPFFIKGREFPELAKIKQVLVNGIPGINATTDPEVFLLQVGGVVKDTSIRYFARAAACKTKDEAQAALKKKLESKSEVVELREPEKEYIRQTFQAIKEELERPLNPEASCRPAVVKAAEDLRRSDIAILDRIVNAL